MEPSEPKRTRRTALQRALDLLPKLAPEDIQALRLALIQEGERRLAALKEAIGDPQ